jgi:hypothetical protein
MVILQVGHYHLSDRGSRVKKLMVVVVMVRNKQWWSDSITIEILMIIELIQMRLCCLPCWILLLLPMRKRHGW